MSLVTDEILGNLRGELSRLISQPLYEHWFADTEILAWDGERLEVGVKNRFFKSRIETKYLSELRQAAETVLGQPVQVAVSVSSRLYAQFREAQERDRAEVEAAALTDAQPVLLPPAEPARTKPCVRGLDLNPEFTFDAFVVGPSNRLSQAVALRAAESPGEYGRVYFCGQHGVGKTHLLQAMCHEVKRLRPGARVAYVTCEHFVADFVSAHATSRLKEFRAGYRECDFLAIDQVSTLGEGNKAATQSELLAILDHLEASGGQVAFADASAPDELTGVDPRLRDRFGAGMVDRMQLPDERTRAVLVAGKMAEKGLRLPEEAAALLARELSGNVRRVLGAVARLAALMRLEGMEPTTACIRMALDVSTPGGKRGALTIGDIVGATAEEYGLTSEAVLGRGRAGVLRRARQVSVVLCRKLLGSRWAELGAAFGGRTHATMLSLVDRVPEGVFSSGLEGRPVERILFRLGLSIKPEEILERQRGLFD